ncbi:MAG: hypothetical protein EOO16_00820 [Chitinophagaceae bacterium]|nr:MAG: hypothetical protein EOO16_00820 [Chitinophagaceae bacterium]
MERRYFAASLDNTARIITVLVTLLFVGVAWITVDVIGTLHEGRMSWIPLPTLAIIWGLTYALHPKGYRVSAGELTVCRLLLPRTFATADILSAEVLGRDAISWSIRTFGVGGLFGYYGKFANRKLGAMTWYLSRRDRVVLLRMKDGRKIVLSPDEPEAFIAAIGH